MKLTDLNNIEPTLSLKLNKIGVKNLNDLVNLGSENAIIKLSTIENCGACPNILFALEGAIQGIRWHNLEPEKKLELKEFFNTLSKKSNTH